MRPKINIPASIQKKRIVRNSGFWDFFIELLHYGVLILIFPFIGNLALIKSIGNSNSNESILLALLSSFLGLFILYRVTKINRLIRISGVNNEINRELSKIAAENLSWNEVNHNKKFSIFSRNPKWESWDYGRELTIIYDKNDILINCACFGRRNIRSPFHWIVTRRCEEKFIQELKKIIKDPY